MAPKCAKSPVAKGLRTAIRRGRPTAARSHHPRREACSRLGYLAYLLADGREHRRQPASRGVQRRDRIHLARRHVVVARRAHHRGRCRRWADIFDRRHAGRRQRSGVVSPRHGPGDFGDDDSDPDWSPDGTHMAVARTTWFCERCDLEGVAIADLANETITMIAEEVVDPSWSPDGTRLVAAAGSSGEEHSRDLSSSSCRAKGARSSLATSARLIGNPSVSGERTTNSDADAALTAPPDTSRRHRFRVSRDEVSPLAP